MSGFPVPAKAIGAAMNARRQQHGTSNGLQQQVEVTLILQAALPALAEDPDLIERLGVALQEQSGRPMNEVRKVLFEAQAEKLLAALFGAASPSTKETDKNG